MVAIIQVGTRRYFNFARSGKKKKKKKKLVEFSSYSYKSNFLRNLVVQ